MCSAGDVFVCLRWKLSSDEPTSYLPRESVSTSVSNRRPRPINSPLSLSSVSVTGYRSLRIRISASLGLHLEMRSISVVKRSDFKPSGVHSHTSYHLLPPDMADLPRERVTFNPLTGMVPDEVTMMPSISIISRTSISDVSLSDRSGSLNLSGSITDEILGEFYSTTQTTRREATIPVTPAPFTLLRQGILTSGLSHEDPDEQPSEPADLGDIVSTKSNGHLPSRPCIDKTLQTESPQPRSLRLLLPSVTQLRAPLAMVTSVSSAAGNRRLQKDSDTGQRDPDKILQPADFVASKMCLILAIFIVSLCNVYRLCL